MKTRRQTRSEPTSRARHERLLRAMVAGDRAALAELYEATSASVFGLASQLVRETRVAEEVTMDTYLEAWDGAAAYEPCRGSVEVWLLTIARSHAIDRLRSGAVRPDAFHPGASHTGEEACGPLVRGMGLEEERLVQLVLHELPPQQRDALLLVYNRGLSHRRAAAELGEPVGTIQTRVRLSLQGLRNALPREES